MSEQKPSEQEYGALIRLAALAAGHEIQWVPEWLAGLGSWMRRVVPEPTFPYSEWVPWNPLEDDSDALRLAVALELEIYHGIDDGAQAVFVGYPSGVRIVYVAELWGKDKFAATRRAIFRAAVEIGRAIEKKGVAS